MDLGIAGRVALVTAATRGIGLGIARVLAAEGARVSVVARTPAEVERTASELGGAGVVADLTTAEGARVSVVARTPADVDRTASELGGAGVVADLTTTEGCEAAVEQTRRALGKIDILVNNLGVRAGSSWEDTGAEEFATAVAGNLLPAVRLSKLVLPEMRRRGWGRVVVISSVFGREAGGAPAYNAAKAAENSFVTALGRDVAADGITVNAVAPGSILFEGGGWWRRREQNPEQIARFVEQEMPLGRFGTVEEVADVVAFVCSARASLVNGAVLAVDGGQSRSIV